jgi:hypothetical protein
MIPQPDPHDNTTLPLVPLWQFTFYLDSLLSSLGQHRSEVSFSSSHKSEAKEHQHTDIKTLYSLLPHMYNMHKHLFLEVTLSNFTNRK